MVKEMVMIFAG